MGDRCTGKCCRVFFLPRNSFADLQAQAARGNEEAIIVLDMVGPDHPPDYHGPYACKYVAENGDCTIYDRRPRMCRTYPNGSVCGHGDECEWDDARLGRVNSEGQAPCKKLVLLRHMTVGKRLTFSQLWAAERGDPILPAPTRGSIELAEPFRLHRPAGGNCTRKAEPADDGSLVRPRTPAGDGARGRTALAVREALRAALAEWEEGELDDDH